MTTTTETATTDGDAPTNVIASGGNLAPLKADIKKAIIDVMDLKAKRTAISGEINEIKSDLVGKGVPKGVFNQVLKEYETSLTEDGADTLRAAMTAYWITREAMGLEDQVDMFEAGPGKGKGNGAGKKH